MPNILGETVCKDCGEIIVTPVFNSRGVMHSRCRECLSKRSQELRREREARNPELKQARILSMRRGELKRRYGITYEEYNQKMEFQLNGCAICKRPFHEFNRDPAVDHDHNTGQVRDLLCWKCNAILGFACEDDGILFACIEYLKRHAKRIAI